MKLENRDIITLAKKVAGARSASTSFNFDGKDYSVGAANEALRDQFNLLGFRLQCLQKKQKRHL